MKNLLLLAVLIAGLGLVPGCASVRAPGMFGAAWTGQDEEHLIAELRTALDPLPEGWLLKAPESTTVGSFAYRKRSGTYDFSESGYFAVHPQWRSDETYVGLLKPGGIFCVVNPEMQADVTGNTVTTYRVYDYCVQLHRQ